MAKRTPVLVAIQPEHRLQLQQGLGQNYQVLEELGRGSFGVVYAVRDLKLQRDLAVKMLLFPTPEGLRRFEREAELVAKLRHPNIVPVYFVGEADGLSFMVMPRIPGSSLRSVILAEHTLPLQEACRIAVEVAAALDAVHGLGIVHRDIKPENLLLEGTARQVHVTDFGIAKVFDSSRLTAGTVIGTAEYMSPEQCAGDPGIDGRSDVYSLGCVVYEMLLGTPPFRGRSDLEIVQKHLTQSPSGLRRGRPDIAVLLEKQVLKALEKAPANRFSTAGQFAQGLMSSLVLEGPRKRWWQFLRYVG